MEVQGAGNAVLNLPLRVTGDTAVANKASRAF